MAMLATLLMLGCMQKPASIPGLKEVPYIVPFPLQQAGEHVDILMWIPESDQLHQLNLVMVERRDWPKEKQDDIGRIEEGWVPGETGKPVTPYPVRLRLRIDAMDEQSDVHVDKFVSERSPRYFRSMEQDVVLWRAQALYTKSFKPGVYRVRLENLVALPQIDFQTLFVFEHYYRK